MYINQAIPTHIITGFLGAGKTTLLKKWLVSKPENEVWAVLMNEFGQIGLDQTWVAERGIAVKEVLGGCLCCTSQLPMQITLSRLISEYKPHRLFIEPTGLGHPKDLFEQLSQSHWQTTINLRQTITVIDGSRLGERLWEKHDVFIQQLDAAQHIVLSHADQMNDQDEKQLLKLKESFEYSEKSWYKVDHGEIDFKLLDQDYQKPVIKKQHLLSQTNIKRSSSDHNQTPKTLPYHYVSEANGYIVAGWHMPKSWQFDADTLLQLLQQLKGWQRIKAKLHTSQGWIDINAIPHGFEIDFAAKSYIDQRLEIITHQHTQWKEFELSMLSTKIKEA